MPSPNRRLDSWKEIAEYLGRGLSTVRRWEENGLPVHRVPGGVRQAVFAFTGEIDQWMVEAGEAADAAAPLRSGSNVLLMPQSGGALPAAELRPAAADPEALR
jgi:hypothetical protein